MTAPKYLPPKYNAPDRVGAQDCIDRAQRALEVAENNLDAIAAQMDGQRNSGADVLAHADARARVGQGWAALALAMRTGR